MAKVIQLTAGLRAEYSRQRKATEQRQLEINRLIEENMPLVETIARRVWRMYTRAGQNGYSTLIEMEDMVACGYIGLVQAAQRYEPGRGSFAGFAYRRIQGAIIERYRRGAYRELQNESIDAYLETEDPDGHGRRHFEYEHLQDPSARPDQIVVRREVEQLAVRAIRLLPDEERMVIIDALRGAGVDETAEAHGKSVAWARAKLATAREKVAQMVARDQRAA